MKAAISPWPRWRPCEGGAYALRESFQAIYERLNASNGFGEGQDFNYRDLNCLFSPQRRDRHRRLADCDGMDRYEKEDVARVVDAVCADDAPVYAMIAPAFQGQFSPMVTPGKLRDAFKRMGFSGMIEVALFADILTLKEAFEFDRHILTDKDFLLASCCCPLWIALIRKSYSHLVPHIPPSVSPMVACGRSIKKLCPEAVTVFIGPCIAKKVEAREPDIAGAVDYVLTFDEAQSMFLGMHVDPAKCEDDLRDHSSAAGRIYARVGGVSRAVQHTLDRVRPGRPIPLRAVQANGMRECKAVMNDVLNGNTWANFLEGMGCPGGCVGGPRRLLSVEEGTHFVNGYGGRAAYGTPIDNPYVIELLRRLGFETVESLLEDASLFTRRFNQ